MLSCISSSYEHPNCSWIFIPGGQSLKADLVARILYAQVNARIRGKPQTFVILTIFRPIFMEVRNDLFPLLHARTHTKMHTPLPNLPCLHCLLLTHLRCRGPLHACRLLPPRYVRRSLHTCRHLLPCTLIPYGIRNLMVSGLYRHRRLPPRLFTSLKPPGFHTHMSTSESRSISLITGRNRTRIRLQPTSIRI